ncbi:MAG: plasmid partitioning protein [Myxococcales bacterium]|nr:hypothetical protein [Myxococcales bacterium]MCB9712235.1 plasmid partitioning protein [Myxococcales bacterium]
MSSTQWMTSMVMVMGLAVGGCDEPEAAVLDDEARSPTMDVVGTARDASEVASSVCDVGATYIDCEAESIFLDVDGEDREVLYRVPPGSAPAGGWPVVIALHGTNDPAGKFFDWSYFSFVDQAFGGYYETKTTQGLLDAGFAVLAPKARVRAGSIYWDTNIPPYASDWESSPDAALFEQLFDEIDMGTFGPLDSSRKYAMGLSSGGYQASRLAVEYPEEIQAIALQSASYATCISSFPCSVSAQDVPDDHPPTLLMAGYWDGIVPLYTIEPYAEALDDDGTEVVLEVVGYASHQWTSYSPGWVLSWFQTH